MTGGSFTQSHNLVHHVQACPGALAAIWPKHRMGAQDVYLRRQRGSPFSRAISSMVRLPAVWPGSSRMSDIKHRQDTMKPVCCDQGAASLRPNQGLTLLHELNTM